jgi:23S rRNA (uracil1939-C5)-methyltransferase
LLLTIEKLIYGGDGLARLPADAHGRGKAVFIPFVLDGERIQASLTEQKSSFARATVESIVEPSPHRVQPRCPYFGSCGGCQYQHASYEHQVEVKKEILRENLRRIAKLELPYEISVHPSPPWNYRNRARLQVRTKSEFVAGYFKLASHDVIAVEECPISSPLINRGIAMLWQSGRAGQMPEGLREVEFFANADDSQLLVELWCAAEVRRAAVREWAENLRATMAEIAGVVAFRAHQPGERAAIQQEIFLSDGEKSLTYQTEFAAYRVSAGAFFQTNRHLTDELVKIVTQGCKGGLALDLYAGVGLFSTVLARDFHHVVSVEPSHPAAADLRYNLPANGEVIQATTEQFLSRPEDRKGTVKGASLPLSVHKADLVVVDPPRSGLEERVARALANMGAPRLTYVSCDPATLARDLVPLLAAGYQVEQAHLVDLFPHTYHLESVLHLVR